MGGAAKRAKPAAHAGRGIANDRAAARFTDHGDGTGAKCRADRLDWTIRHTTPGQRYQDAPGRREPVRTDFRAVSSGDGQRAKKLTTNPRRNSEAVGRSPTGWQPNVANRRNATKHSGRRQNAWIAGRSHAGAVARRLPSKNRFARQHRFSSGEIADAVIFLRDKLLSIDSKFPLDAYRRIAEEGEEARRAFATAVKNHADAISKKYVLPEEATLPVALMFVPSESVYYELLMTTDAKSTPLDEYCRSKNVVAVSPNTLYANLQIILMGLQGMQIEENAKNLRANLAGLQSQLRKFVDPFEKLGTHLKNAAQSYAEADKRFEKAETSVEAMLAGDSVPQIAGDPQGTLALPVASKQSA